MAGAFVMPEVSMTATAAEPIDRAEITEALAHLLHAARREYPVVGTLRAPTPWDRRHMAINELLCNLELFDARLP